MSDDVLGYVAQFRPTAPEAERPVGSEKDETPRDTEGFHGAPGAIRTPDPQIRRLALADREASAAHSQAADSAQGVGTATSEGQKAQGARGIRPNSGPRDPADELLEGLTCEWCGGTGEHAQRVIEHTANPGNTHGRARAITLRVTCRCVEDDREVADVLARLERVSRRLARRGDVHELARLVVLLEGVRDAVTEATTALVLPGGAS